LNLYIYDWRSDFSLEISSNTFLSGGVGVAFEEGEDKCSCYNVGNLSNPLDWDISILESQKHFSFNMSSIIRNMLSSTVPVLIMLEEY
jgi:hypothetical protein